MRCHLTLYVILLGCTVTPKDKLNHESIILHNSMLKKANMMEHRLNEIAKDTTDINPDSVQVLRRALDEWKADLIEVPGNEDHTHHDHTHGHQPAPDVTQEQMLEIQMELDSRLSAIGKRIYQQKPELMNDEHFH